jgi:hypothetical protein
MVPDWKTAVMQDRSELVRDAYVAIARAKLAKGDQMVDGLRELMVEDVFKPFRATTALEFLRDFPNADPYRLNELFDGVFAVPAAHSGFLALADRVLTGAVPIGQRQQDMWLGAAFCCHRSVTRLSLKPPRHCGLPSCSTCGIARATIRTVTDNRVLCHYRNWSSWRD